MKKFTIFILLILGIVKTEAQDYQISFTGTGSSSTVDSVLIENLTQGTSLAIAGSDILNLIVTVGTSESITNAKHSVHVIPNPMYDACTIDFETDLKGNSTFTLYDLTGKLILLKHEFLTEGLHFFNLKGINKGVYVLKIASVNQTFSTKIICLNPSEGETVLSYSGTWKAIDKQLSISNGKQKTGFSLVDMEYTLDDYLKITGKSGIYRTVRKLKPTLSQTVNFNFIPCTDADNKHYATLQVGTQIWMAENVDVGIRINGNQSQTNNGTLEKYYYNDNAANGETYGGLYSWDEMMQYENTESVKGICPDGFHIPTDQEWLTLNTYLNGIPASGAKMKETGFNHWFSPNTAATNESGYSALPGGTRNANGAFQDLGYKGKFWTSSPINSTNAWGKYLSYNTPDLLGESTNKSIGSSCRCIQDDAIELTKLAGETTKTWKLLRDVSTGNYPLEVGPYDRSTIWWAMGYNNNELYIRPCMLNDEWTFGRDRSMVFDAKGDYWAEGGLFIPANICASTDQMVGPNGEDQSAWGSGSHTYQLITIADPKLKVIGNGAYLGLCKVGTDYEFYVPQDSITYDIVSLYDGTTDTLIVESNYYFAQGDTQYGGYWRFVLVHYDDPNDEPPIPVPAPVASYAYSLNELTATFINTSSFGESYFWDFGDGATSTEVNPAHTFAVEGSYIVTLTAYNSTGENSISHTILITSGTLTEELLVGGAWRIPVSDHSIYVGPGMGSDAWWITPLAYLDGTYVGTENDWSCMADDDFIFSAGGGFEYETNGSSRNDGYFGQPNGCWTDEEIANSGNGAAFGSCDTHTFNFTPATDNSRAIITLTNGPGFAAFIGFMKGYYGGENVYGENPPNGGYATNQYEVIGYVDTGEKEILIVSVDISPDHSGTASWTMVMER